jgi:hypothetical protein
MVHSANGHRPRKGGNSGAPPDLDTTALALHSTEHGRHPHPDPLPLRGRGSRFYPLAPEGGEGQGEGAHRTRNTRS